MDPVGFRPDDAQQLIDLLNPVPEGHRKPAPIKQLLCVLVRVEGLFPATCQTPGSGRGTIMQTVLQSGVDPFLERLIWSPTRIVINLRTWRTAPVPFGTFLIARREELRNEWTI